MGKWLDGTTAEINIPQRGPYQLIFAYTNHRDEEHVYTVQPISFAFAPYGQHGLDRSEDAPSKWVMHAHVLERDGEPRPVRRTFILSTMKDVIHVHAQP